MARGACRVALCCATDNAGASVRRATVTSPKRAVAFKAGRILSSTSSGAAARMASVSGSWRATPPDSVWCAPASAVLTTAG